MIKCIQWIWQLITKCLSVFSYSSVRSADQHYQMQQFGQVGVGLNSDKEIAHDLEVELSKENYQQEYQAPDLEMQNTTSHQKLLEKKEVVQVVPIIDTNEIRQFIETTPVVDFSNVDTLVEIGNKSVDIFMTMINDLSGFEQLENNQDEFSYWIKYVETPEKFQIHQMRYTFTLNTTIEKYMAFMKNLSLQKSLDQSVDQFETHFSEDRLQINYLRYKKILFMDPRDFLYVKYTRGIDDDSIVEISKSVESEEFQPLQQTTKPTTRALLLLSGNYVRQIAQNKLEITTYSECNMKLKLKPIMTKTASKNEIKKLIKKYRDHFNKQ